jgi:hypothetical protein
LQWTAKQMPNIGLGATLAELETKANAILKRYERDYLGKLTASQQAVVDSAGLDYLLQQKIDQTRDEIVNLNDRDPTRKSRELRMTYMKAERLSDAIEVLDRVARLRILYQSGNIQEAIVDGICLGRTLERTRVRAFEPYTWRGVHTHHQIVESKKALKKFQPEYAKYQSAFDEWVKKDPRARRWTICRMLARTFGVNAKTMRRHIKDLRSTR